MKNSGQCPKCQSLEVVHVPTSPYHHIPVGMFKGVVLGRYICTDCGFCEEWIDLRQDREALKTHYQSAAESAS